MEFFKWFDSRENREIDPWREFCEELVEPGILPAEIFRHIKYAYVGKHQEGILKNEDYIKSETLTDSLVFVDALESGTEIDFDDIKTMILISK